MRSIDKFIFFPIWSTNFVFVFPVPIGKFCSIFRNRLSEFDCWIICIYIYELNEHWIFAYFRLLTSLNTHALALCLPEGSNLGGKMQKNAKLAIFGKTCQWMSFPEFHPFFYINFHFVLMLPVVIEMISLIWHKSL